MKCFNKVPIFSTMFLLLTACGHKKNVINETNVLHANEETLTKVIIYDVFTPPVASRIYAYTNLASYEAIRFANPKYNSLTVQLKGFGAMPQPHKGKRYNYTLAATKAFFIVAHKLTFSVDTLQDYEDKIYAMYKSDLDDSTYMRSVVLGEQIGKIILKRAAFDNYPQTRGKPKYLGSNGHAQWRPTPPDYFDGVEYCWGTMEPLAINSSKQFPLPKPVAYSTDTNSEYIKQARQVYQLNKNLTQEQILIARFWDDNPFTVEHDGHMMFADKKITPGGHWIGITSIACKQTHAYIVKTAQAYALTSIALFDAFIGSWEAKYEYSFIRPVSVIDEVIDHAWMPLLQTPPFPEYPAGHADISGSSAVVLTSLFGDNFKFHDTTEMRYIGLDRNFDSFLKAADETAMSRNYGGIHFLNSVKMGSLQGREIGEFIVKKLKLKN